MTCDEYLAARRAGDGEHAHLTECASCRDAVADDRGVGDAVRGAVGSLKPAKPLKAPKRGLPVWFRKFAAVFVLFGSISTGWKLWQAQRVGRHMQELADALAALQTAQLKRDRTQEDLWRQMGRIRERISTSDAADPMALAALLDAASIEGSVHDVAALPGGFDDAVRALDDAEPERRAAGVKTLQSLRGQVRWSQVQSGVPDARKARLVAMLVGASMPENLEQAWEDSSTPIVQVQRSMMQDERSEEFRFRQYRDGSVRLEYKRDEPGGGEQLNVVAAEVADLARMYPDICRRLNVVDEEGRPVIGLPVPSEQRLLEEMRRIARSGDAEGMERVQAEAVSLSLASRVRSRTEYDELQREWEEATAAIPEVAEARPGEDEVAEQMEGGADPAALRREAEAIEAEWRERMLPAYERAAQLAARLDAVMG